MSKEELKAALEHLHSVYAQQFRTVTDAELIKSFIGVK